jgi:hypothetical protein
MIIFCVSSNGLLKTKALVNKMSFSSSKFPQIFEKIDAIDTFAMLEVFL